MRRGEVNAAKVSRGVALAQRSFALLRMARLVAVHVACEQCGVTQREIGAACGVTPFVSKMRRRAAALQATDRMFRQLIASTSIALQI